MGYLTIGAAHKHLQFIRTILAWVITWSPLTKGFLKFNADEAARGKSGSAGIKGVLHNNKGEVKISMFTPIGVKDSNEAKVLPILEALRIYFIAFHESLIV